MRIALIVAFVLATGCKDKTGPAVTPGSQTPPPPAADAAVAAKPPDREPLQLPKLSGKPPVKTKVKHTKEQYEAIGKLRFDGWDGELRRAFENGVDVKHGSKPRPKVEVRVSISPCLKCVPMDVEQWRAQKEALKVQLRAELRDKPDTVFEIGETTLGGEKVISIYQLGWAFGKDENGPTGAYMNSYVLHYNDGVNQIKLMTSYVDDPPASKEELAKIVPREHLEKIGIAFLDQYVQAW